MGLNIMEVLRTTSSGTEYYPSSQSIACPNGVAVDAIEELSTASQSGLTYDAVANQYVYVWKTDKTWAGKCRQLVVQLNGTAPVSERRLTADFQFTK
jgi:hypothetical protein